MSSNRREISLYLRRVSLVIFEAISNLSLKMVSVVCETPWESIEGLFFLI